MFAQRAPTTESAASRDLQPSYAPYIIDRRYLTPDPDNASLDPNPDPAASKSAETSGGTYQLPTICQDRRSKLQQEIKIKNIQFFTLVFWGGGGGLEFPQIPDGLGFLFAETRVKRRQTPAAG